jgi:hypothetical protein
MAEAATTTPEATAPAATTTQPAATPTDWTTGFNDDQKAFVTTKGFKAPSDILESYRNFEKLQGVPQDRLLKLPENMDTPEGRAVFERLGTPKEAKDYNLAALLPKENADPKLADWAQGVFHEIGMPRGMAEKFIKKWNERSGSSHKEMTDARTAMLNQADQNLKSTWGNAYDRNKELANQGAMALGLDEKAIGALGSALGPDKAMLLLHKLATATGEANFHDGTPAGSDIMSVQEAKGKIASMMSDKTFAKRLSEGDTDARRQWDNAHKMAYPGTISL